MDSSDENSKLYHVLFIGIAAWIDPYVESPTAADSKTVREKKKAKKLPKKNSIIKKAHLKYLLQELQIVDVPMHGVNTR